MRTYISDAETRNKLNSKECGTTDCHEIPTTAIFLVENLDRINLLGVSCDEHKYTLGEIFGMLGAQTQVHTEPLDQFKQRIVNG